MNYRTVKCFNRQSGDFAGYLGTHDNCLTLVQSTAEAAWCKWTYKNGDLHLAKDTAPGDRWLGRATGGYAGWGLDWYAPVTYNGDKTVSLKGEPAHMLYGPTGDETYISWSDTANNAGALTLQLINPRVWLSHVPGDTLIGDINLPGTHDSAAINSTIHTPYACHYRSITEQLEAGVRLLDVRLIIDAVPAGPHSPATWEFYTCHGSTGLNSRAHVYQSLVSLLVECHDFLYAHPSEFIAMSLKIDDQNGVADTDLPGVLKALTNVLANHNVGPWQGDMPSLDTVRKRVYLLDRIIPALLDPNRKPPLDPVVAQQVAAFSFGVSLDIPDNTPGVLLPATKGRNFPIYVQDMYEDLPIIDPGAQKYALYVAAIPNKPADGLLINFASATRLKLGGVYIQDQVVGYFDKNRPTASGWSLFDYEDQSANSSFGLIDCVEIIIASNFAYAI